MFLIIREAKLNDYNVQPHFLGQDLFENTNESTIGYSRIEIILLRTLKFLKITPEILMTKNRNIKEIVKYISNLVMKNA